jgi:hypothetical protein
MTRRDARLFARLKEHAAIVRPELLKRFGPAAHDASPEPCPACAGGGLVFPLRPNPDRSESHLPESAPAPTSARSRRERSREESWTISSKPPV